jgi:pimeloyl-ACP methyl ester carboxylesterase
MHDATASSSQPGDASAISSAWFESDAGRMHYVDEGQGRALVFVHGTPGSGHEFHPAIRALSSRHRCLAADHLGFGRSEKPREGSYTLDAHRERLRAWLEQRKVERFTLVAHDFGGPISIPLALERAARVERLVLINTWFWPLRIDPTFAKSEWATRTALMRFCYRYLNFSARVMVKAAWGTHAPLTREQHRVYLDQFPDAASREGTLGFLRATGLDQSYFDALGNIEALSSIPVLVIWGLADGFVGTPHRERWHELLPHAKFVELDRVGHFPQAEAPELTTRAIAEFLDSTA